MLGRLAAASVIVALLAAPVRAEPPPDLPPPGPLGERDITIANRSALAISDVFASPSTSDSWGDGRLGDAALAPGRSTRLRLGRLRDCAFDLLILYEDGGREERLGHNICRTRQLALDGKARRLPVPPLQQARAVILVNQSARAIGQVFISAADAAEWGDDLLAEPILVGARSRLAYHGACTVDIRVVFENRSAEERRGVDLCRHGEVSIEPGWTTADDMPAPPA